MIYLVFKYLERMNRMKNTEIIKITLPEGTFYGNCRDCRYADWRDVDGSGRVYCDGGYGGYNHPSDRNGCNYYIAM